MYHPQRPVGGQWVFSTPLLAQGRELILARGLGKSSCFLDGLVLDNSDELDKLLPRDLDCQT